MKMYKKILIENSMLDINLGQYIDLSKESLSLQDYQWLGDIIKKSSYLETIKLPLYPKKFIEEIIQILHESIKLNSTLTTIHPDLSEVEDQFSETTLLHYQQLQSYLNRNKNQIFAIHGGGNIGLGLMAEVISKSPFKYEIRATSSNQFNRDLINSTGKYGLQHGSSFNSQTTCVEGVQLVPRESSEIVELYTQANLVAICLTPVAITDEAKNIAEGLIQRYKTDGAGLKILVLMNIPNCDKFVSEKIKEAILSITQDSDYADKILSAIEFVPTVIDRIVTAIEPEKVKNQLRMQLLELNSQPSFQASLKHNDLIDLAKPLSQQIEDILSNQAELIRAIRAFHLQFNLFNAEKRFSIYVPSQFSEARRLPLMNLTNDMERIEVIKNKYINGPHAILAWLGALMGYQTIATAIQNPLIFTFINEMMDQEIKPILKAEYPDILNQEFESLKMSFLDRTIASTDDPVLRVGRDPLRKLDAGARIRGSIELAHKHQLYSYTTRLEFGIAAGILYSIKGKDPVNPGCEKIQEIYSANNNSFAAVLCYQGVAPSGNYTGLDPEKDKRLIASILAKISWLNSLYEERFRSSWPLIITSLSIGQNKPLVDLTFFSSTHRPSFFAQNQNSAALLAIGNRHQTQKLCLFLNNEFKREEPRMIMLHQNDTAMIDKKRFYQDKLKTLGINLDTQTGHLSYDEKFTPLSLPFELVFVRHGETYGNCGQVTATGKIDHALVGAGIKNKENRIFQGDVDQEINQLTAYGEQQAVDLAEKLRRELLDKEWIPDVVLMSPLSRARNTATPFVTQNQFSDRCIILDEIKEMSFGAWDNRRVCDMTPTDICHSFYREQNALVKLSGENGNGTHQDAENLCDVILRVHNTLKRLGTQYRGQRILMFSHSMVGAACLILLGLAQNFEYENFLAFDGKRADGTYYTMPHATPICVNFSLELKNEQILNL
ncbi:MAG: hypothetical protein A3F46_07040 [Legionellales bacterium RIFCSPHIGHO2_12_FULL_42_9]|nr:MAG: hypothetical protein A3F46_07040 [Legionellales bacterium RIFCSPHIGHO2_12_FULL_42_9]